MSDPLEELRKKISDLRKRYRLNQIFAEGVTMSRIEIESLLPSLEAAIAERDAATGQALRAAADMLNGFGERWITRLPMDEAQGLNCKQYAKAILALTPADIELRDKIRLIDARIEEAKWWTIGRADYPMCVQRIESLEYDRAGLVRQLEDIERAEPKEEK